MLKALRSQQFNLAYDNIIYVIRGTHDIMKLPNTKIFSALGIFLKENAEKQASLILDKLKEMKKDNQCGISNLYNIGHRLVCKWNLPIKTDFHEFLNVLQEEKAKTKVEIKKNQNTNTGEEPTVLSRLLSQQYTPEFPYLTRLYDSLSIIASYQNEPQFEVWDKYKKVNLDALHFFKHQFTNTFDLVQNILDGMFSTSNEEMVKRIITYIEIITHFCDETLKWSEDGYDGLPELIRYNENGFSYYDKRDYINEWNVSIKIGIKTIRFREYQEGEWCELDFGINEDRMLYYFLSSYRIDFARRYFNQDLIDFLGKELFNSATF
jgi:hypothetical protein